MNLSSHAPSHTAGSAGGTNLITIFQSICDLNTTIRDNELDAVPIESAAGTWAAGIIDFRMGINSNPAPPPQTAETENANIELKNKSNSEKNISLPRI